MRRIIVLLAVAGAGVLVFASFANSKPTASAAPLRFTATLNVAQTVSPHATGTKAGAAGTFTATLTGTTLKWTLTYSHLTGAAGAAHIHLGARGKTGIALVTLCGPCHSPISGTANSVTDDEGSLMMTGGAYVNVHTTKNAEGEIRGQIKKR